MNRCHTMVPSNHTVVNNGTRLLFVLLSIYFGHFMVCPSLIYGFWLSLWYNYIYKFFLNRLCINCFAIVWHLLLQVGDQLSVRYLFQSSKQLSNKSGYISHGNMNSCLVDRCLTPLSTKFQFHLGSRFYWYNKSEYWLEPATYKRANHCL
jgi:hypothetical protein